jgi:hypothetical protein
VDNLVDKSIIILNEGIERPCPTFPHVAIIAIVYNHLAKTNVKRSAKPIILRFFLCNPHAGLEISPKTFSRKNLDLTVSKAFSR